MYFLFMSFWDPAQGFSSACICCGSKDSFAAQRRLANVFGCREHTGNLEIHWEKEQTSGVVK